jgi:NAD(P)H-dependent FMN reductase
MRVLLVSGSLRAGSTNEATLRTVQSLMRDGDVAELYDGMAALPHFNPDDDHEPLPAPVVELRKGIADADAVVVCTPEYAGDMPGALKNLLDWTVGGVETEGKPVAWINVSTSPMRAAGTHRALRTVLTYTGCVVVDDACADVPVARDAIEEGTIVDESVRDKLTELLEALGAHVNAH